MKQLVIPDQEEVVREMIRNNSEILNTKIDGDLPIHIAARNSGVWHSFFQDFFFSIRRIIENFALADKENMVKIIIDLKPDQIDVKNDNEETPLFLTISSNGKFSFGRLNVRKQMRSKCHYNYFVQFMLL